MEWSLSFFLNSILLGVGLAMDAFSVSLANGLNDPKMRKGKMGGIAGVFAGFQFAMPLVGWICVHTVVAYFRAFEKVVPWVALLLLAVIGGKMLFEGIRNRGGEKAPKNRVSASVHCWCKASRPRSTRCPSGSRLPNTGGSWRWSPAC